MGTGMNVEVMDDDLKSEMDDAAEVLGRKKISVSGAVYLANTVLLPRALYRLKLSNAADRQIDQVQSALRKTIASKAHITAANSSILWKGPRPGGLTLSLRDSRGTEVRGSYSLALAAHARFPSVCFD